MVTIFVFLLPLLNALLDWLSWGVSRTLGRRLLATPGRWRGVAHALLDLVAALALLTTLAWVMTATVTLVDRLALAKVGHAVLRPAALLRLAEVQPFGAGFWITAMLFSTLVPTVFHLGFALYSAVLLPGRPDVRARSRERIERAVRPRGQRLAEHERREIAGYLFWHRSVGAVVLTLAVVAGLTALWTLGGSAWTGNPLLLVARHALRVVGP